jgi:uncharacterized protein (DUF1330 family)
MPAYLLAHLAAVTDATGFEEYRTKVQPLVHQYGGRYLAVGSPDVKEGEYQPIVVAVIEFPSLERLNAFYDAAEYQELKALRQRTTRGNLLFLDGAPSQ